MVHRWSAGALAASACWWLAAAPVQASMIATLRQVTPAELERLQRDPAAVSELLAEAWGDPLPSAPGAVARSAAPLRPALDLDKSWHGLHYLLSGTATVDNDAPLSLAILGGREIGDDIGYGPARYLTPGQVQAISAALSAVSSTTLPERFNARAMHDAQIYPDIWLDDETALELLLSHFDPLVQFYADAAAKGNAILLCLE